VLSETVAAWKGLEGQIIDGRLRLEALESHERIPVFSAVFDDRPVTVRFFHEPDPSHAVFDRHREAAFLTHPSLLACLGTGTVTLRDGERFTYGVYESPNILLSTILEAKTFTPEEIRALCLDVLDGLDFLHSHGLVYGNLDRTTVARCGDRWKLCDYSELRPEGSGYMEETRRLLGVLPGAPPEAFSGVVTPAWDSWSLAHMLRSLVAEPGSARNADGTPKRPPRTPELPEPFRTIAAGCLVPDPGSRSTTAEIRQQLADETAVPAAAAAFSPVPAAGQAEQATPAPLAEPQFSTPWDRMPPTRRITPSAILIGVATAVGLLFLVSGYISRHDIAASPQPAAVTDPTEPSRSRSAAVDPESQIQAAVNKWAEAFRNKDLDTEVSLYAPRVRRFFLKSNVTPEFIRQTKQSALRSAGEIRRYDLQNLTTRFDGPDAATVTFDKVWDFAGSRRHTGKVRGELKFERQNGAWRIVSERDLKVYSQTRSRS
jgi:ketosteroid isomerase-like protein